MAELYKKAFLLMSQNDLLASKRCRFDCLHNPTTCAVYCFRVAMTVICSLHWLCQLHYKRQKIVSSLNRMNACWKLVLVMRLWNNRSFCGRGLASDHVHPYWLPPIQDTNLVQCMIIMFSFLLNGIT